MAISPTKKIYGTEEAIAHGLMELFKTAKSKSMLLSELDDEEILNLSLLFTWSDLIGSKTLRTFCVNFLKLRVSKTRMGRREVVAISSNIAGAHDRKRFKSIKDMFSGIRI